MASHFRQQDEGPRGAHAAHAAPSGEAGGTTQMPRAPREAAPREAGPRQRLATGRGGDESYHAPEGNPHAAGIPHAAEGFVSVVSEPEGSRRGHDRRRREPRFAETDPYDISGRRSRSPLKRVGRVLSVLLFVVGIGLIVVAAALWVNTQRQYAEQERVNEELAAYVEASDDGETPPQVDWEGLRAVNDEVVGWVQIPGTVVNYPVYQASDNEKYLNTSAEGEYTIGGQIFMDYENAAPGMVDAQTVIYGHHLRDGSMFKTISDMQSQEMFDSVSVVWYVTEAGAYKLQPLMAYPTSEDDADVRRFNFSSAEEFRSYLTERLGESTASRSDAADVIAGATQALSLCTCYYDDADKGRAVLVCVPVAYIAAEAATE